MVRADSLWSTGLCTGDESGTRLFGCLVHEYQYSAVLYLSQSSPKHLSMFSNVPLSYKAVQSLES